MDALPSRTKEPLPQRGEPRLASCDVCGHRHACYVAERSDPNQAQLRVVFHVCLGCLMRAADPTARDACAECVFPT